MVTESLVTLTKLVNTSSPVTILRWLTIILWTGYPSGKRLATQLNSAWPSLSG